MSKDQKRKALVFDIDKSLSTLGSVERQTEIFGVQPLKINNGISSLNALLDNALKIKRKPIIHPVLGDTGEVEHSIAFSEKGEELGVNMLIFDTLSMLGTYERSATMKENGLLVMDMRSWGLYATAMEKLINKMKMMEFPVVATSHLSSDQDEQGNIIEYPALKGSIKKDCGRYFDVIAYARISKDAQGKATKYSWIVQSDRKHIMAKNRGNVLEPVIPQDIGYIIDTYELHGEPNPKILILGHSGQGKSWSLQTINGIEEKEVTEANNNTNSK